MGPHIFKVNFSRKSYNFKPFICVLIAHLGLVHFSISVYAVIFVFCSYTLGVQNAQILVKASETTTQVINETPRAMIL